VHPRALDRMNKRMTLETFAEAAGQLRRRGVSLRVFLLISPPFVLPEEQDSWLLRSIEAAFSCGASVVSLIPTRPGNGALEALASDEAFRVPRLEDIDRSLELGLEIGRDGRLFVDLWDLRRFADCQECFEARRARLHAMNLEQRVLSRPPCADCGFGSH
jgi:archaeosine synthase beta-subunit